ncbi:unnamed protein product [Closterium sp. Naga37s-1]|nr:unnamed protein product [Closterium sp. Naga37s-1]
MRSRACSASFVRTIPALLPLPPAARSFWPWLRADAALAGAAAQITLSAPPSSAPPSPGARCLSGGGAEPLRTSSCRPERIGQRLSALASRVDYRAIPPTHRASLYTKREACTFNPWAAAANAAGSGSNTSGGGSRGSSGSSGSGSSSSVGVTGVAGRLGSEQHGSSAADTAGAGDLPERLRQEEPGDAAALQDGEERGVGGDAGGKGDGKVEGGLQQGHAGRDLVAEERAKRRLEEAVAALVVDRRAREKVERKVEVLAEYAHWIQTGEVREAGEGGWPAEGAESSSVPSMSDRVGADVSVESAEAKVAGEHPEQQQQQQGAGGFESFPPDFRGPVKFPFSELMRMIVKETLERSPGGGMGGVGVEASELEGLEGSPPASARPSPPRCLLFTPADLTTITNGFAQENFIVNGEYGSLYYGRLDPTNYGAPAGGSGEGKQGESSSVGTLLDESGGGGGTQRSSAEAIEVAVKLLRFSSKREAIEVMDMFTREVDILQRVQHHPHIVRLVGRCKDPLSVSLALVYEFMPGGSLQEQLLMAKLWETKVARFFGPEASKMTHAEAAAAAAAGTLSLPPPPSPARSFPPPLPLHLSWRDRIRIAAEIASALLCLHQFHPPILHRDLKPDNILLDQSRTSKLAGMGLSCVVPSSSSSHPVVMGNVRGTPGFVDTETIFSKTTTVKTDMYAFGMVLMLLLTRFPEVEDEIGYLHFMPSEIRWNPARAAALIAGLEGTGTNSGSEIDDRMGGVSSGGVGQLDPSAGEWDVGLAHRLLVVAMRCLERTSERRPCMEEVMHAVGAVARDAAALGAKGVE